MLIFGLIHILSFTQFFLGVRICILLIWNYYETEIKKSNP